ncbi:MAG: gliding motility-associated C-terminal domain-containing protein [Bacteroidetes bacterium]|nr:gliding motility-associated C-terminal domain-containing protein [Bacteroidota bacterium]
MKKSAAFANRIIVSAFLIFPAFTVMAQKDSKQVSVTSQTGVNWPDESMYREQLKNKGIPAVTIDKLVEEKKALLLQGRHLVPLTNSIKISDQNPVVQSLCSDMGAEAGWGSWTARTGQYGSCQEFYGAPNSPFAPKFNLTIGSGTDSLTPGLNLGDPPLPVVCPGFGNASIQIGEIETNGALGGCGSSWGCIEELTYPLTVIPQDTNFTFAYAIVIEDPGHDSCNQPFVSLCIYDSSGNSIGTCGCFTYTAGPNMPGFYTANRVVNSGSIPYYKPWTIVGINLAPYLGQTLTVKITNADCGWGGHFAQSYWDFNCGPMATTTHQFCVGADSVLLTVPPAGGTDYSYSWSTGQTTTSIMVNPQVLDTLTLNIVPLSGCGFYEVYVLTPTIINPGFSDSIHCNMVYFKDTTKITGGTISNWNWSFPGGNPSSYSGKNPIVSYAAAGTYSASVIITSQASCRDTSAGVMITISPNAVANAGPDLSICSGTTRTLCASGGATYVWQPGGSTTSCITVKPSSSTTYTLVAANSNGCGSTVLKKVTVDNIPVLSASVNSTICAGDSAALQANVQSGQSPYSWYWYPQSALNNPNVQNPIASPGTTTNFTVSVTDAYGCTANTSTTVYVQAVPNVKFTSWTPTLSCDGFMISLKATMSSDVQSVFWDFGDGSSITLYAPNTDPGSHSYPLNGTYNITTTAFNPPCKSTHDTTLVVSEIMKLMDVLPSNVFTPNGDNNNDCFHPAICNLAAVTPTTPCPQQIAMTDCLILEVYDRWGIKMFETTDSKKCWDGTTMKGNPAKAGTYYYISKFAAITLKGFVELLR